MAKPVTPHDLFDLWQKMVNPGAYPLQSLMFPGMDVKDIEKKIAELETVEHWLRANLNMLQLSIKSLEYQRALLKGGEKVQAEVPAAAAGLGDMPNPMAWAMEMMADAAKSSAQAVSPPRRKRRK
jgi:hypothetical protein